MKGHRVLVTALLCLLTAAPAAFTACGGAQPGGSSGSTTTTTTPESTVLSIEEALVAEPGKPLRLSGALVATGGSVILASVLLESYPPQAGGAQLPLSGLAIDSLVGLSSTADQPGLNQVTWSDYWVVLGGIIKDGVLQVGQIPRVVEAVSGPARVRFSPVSEPLVTGTAVWWALDVKNEGTSPVELSFSSGQRADVILSQNGVEKYRWSAGKVFTEAIETVTIEPGKGLPIVLNDTLRVATGDYDLTALITATVGGSGAPAALPQLKTTIAVH